MPLEHILGIKKALKALGVLLSHHGEILPFLPPPCPAPSWFLIPEGTKKAPSGALLTKMSTLTKIYDQKATRVNTQALSSA